MKRVAVYLRVSTDQQDVASQRVAIENWLRAHPHESAVWYSDKVSGRTTRRPGLDKMNAAIAAGEHDTVVVFRLDRLSRTALMATRLVFSWLETGIEFFATDQPILQLGKDNPIRLTVITLFSELAQMEREAIVSRIKAGMAAKKARGEKLGPKYKLPDDVREALKARVARGERVATLAREFGLHRATVYREVERV